MLPSAGHRRSDSGAGDGVTGRDAVCFIYSDFVVSGWGGADLFNHQKRRKGKPVFEMSI